jgi:two-component system, chemotaxis family, chemotaxis protein CheY
MKSMAENCQQVYKEMTGQTASGIHIDKLEPPFVSVSYKTAIVIPYENKKDSFEGRFILGFNDEHMAVKLARAIAGHTGMPAVDRMDDMATDILSEFMNTVAGKVITEWDQFGMTADFLPPEFVADLRFDDGHPGNLIIHSITLLLPGEEKLTILTSLEETEKSPFKDKKVLIVDDSKMIRFLLAKEFENQGCQVIQAENGLDGVIQYQANQPDLIIMDLIMPKMGGLEAISRIREISPAVPVIILTSTSKKEEVVAAAALKVKGYVKKPIQMDRLLQLAGSCFQ